MLKLRENGLNIDYMYETNSVLRKTAETEISDLTFWLRFGSVRVFINRNRTEIRFPHIPNDVAGPPLLNGGCTSLLRVVVSKMTYTVSSGTLNSTIPCLGVRGPILI